jgi:eukaryotic-like serine/threonine-protein kinase
MRSEPHVNYEFGGTDRFHVTSRLGEGAMGVVYRALDREKNEEVAIKTLRDLDADGLLRFKNEFRSIQNLQHANLISLGELVEASGRWFFTMELVDGCDFYSWVRPRRRREDTLPAPVPQSNDFLAATQPAWISSLGPAPAFDEERLRAAMAQLAQGVAALHRAGFVHRDIKPSNVLVSREGRVVLLDFGFVTPAREGSSDRIVGTAAYMSPEQAASISVSTASDWYAVGVMLYEALTGRTPIDGTPIEILMGKQHRIPVPPSQVVAGVPVDLEELCLELLRVRPEDRPGEKEILRRLGAPATPASSSLSLDLSRSLFVGRERELAELDAAVAAYRAGKTVSVFVHGESGIGKSALVREFTRRLAERDGGILILSSSCYERESVPYKAFDGVIDALSRHLSQLPDVDAAMAVPLHITPVAQVFPVLRRSEVFARAVRPLASTLEPAELRLRMFAGLRELFSRLASRQPVVILVDDFQWADADSLALLRELVRRPEAPHIMLVATVRSGSERRAPGSGSQALELGTDRTEHIHLGGLSSADARTLARKLAEHVAPGLTGVVDAVVDDSGGHPLYIDEMLRYSTMARSAPSSTLQLETVLWHRTLELDETAREILELVALSVGPLEKGVAAAAARVSFGDFSRWVQMLRVGKLVQTTGTRRADRVEMFHDRIRQAVVKNLSPARRRELHERLALALESGGSPAAEALAIHWSGAGERDRAYQYTRMAADEAARALAFERAARLYRRCLDLVDAGPNEIASIQRHVGDALANAGHGAEAANAYLSAAELSTDQSVELYASAAGHLLRSGHVDSGLEVLRRALAPLGLRLPTTPLRAAASLTLQRAAIRLRGLRFRERSELEVSRRDLTRVDVSWALSAGFGLTDIVRGAEFQARHLRMALRTGEPNRVARALAIEVGYRFLAGSRGGASARVALGHAERLAARLGNPANLEGQNTLMGGIGAILEGRWADADDMLRRAESILRERCSGVGWEISSSRIMHLWSLWYLGRVDAIRDRLPTILREAEERGDLYAATSYRTYFAPMARLAADDAPGAAAITAEALDNWSQQGFHFQHYCRLFAGVQIELYAGMAPRALEVVEAGWPELKRSFLLSVQQNKVEALHFRGRAELACGRATGNDRLVGRALSRARTIRREQSVWGDGFAGLLEAGATWTRGDAGGAATLLEAAIPLLEERNMALYAAAARRSLGVVRGGAAGEVLIADGDRAMTELGVANPGRMAAMLVPGFDDAPAPLALAAG